MTRKKVLLVDDSNIVLTMHQMMLGQRAYRLLLARNGKEALEQASHEPPDLILMDVIMPVMDGFEACRILRSREDTRRIPILLLTTRGEPYNVAAGFEAGCTEYLTKPLSSLELLSAIRNHLGE